jgi:serine/threonine protein kinase
MSNIFSLGLILYELLTGQPIFSKELTLYNIAFKVAVKYELPEIPRFVLPSPCELITECWEDPVIGHPLMKSWIDSRKYNSK